MIEKKHFLWQENNLVTYLIIILTEEKTEQERKLNILNSFFVLYISLSS